MLSPLQSSISLNHLGNGSLKAGRFVLKMNQFPKGLDFSGSLSDQVLSMRRWMKSPKPKSPNLWRIEVAGLNAAGPLSEVVSGAERTALEKVLQSSASL